MGLIPHLPPSLRCDRLFVRPDSGLKPFPGLVLDCQAQNLKTWADVASALAYDLRGQAPEKLVCLAPGYRLMPLEWRFWVVNRTVVASSPYSWEDGVVPWQAPPEAALKLAEAMAQNAWQPDIAYVVDVVQRQDGAAPFYINELNAASTSGLYSVPFDALLPALRAAVLAESSGELCLED